MPPTLLRPRRLLQSDRPIGTGPQGNCCTQAVAECSSCGRVAPYRACRRTGSTASSSRPKSIHSEVRRGNAHICREAPVTWDRVQVIVMSRGYSSHAHRVAMGYGRMCHFIDGRETLLADFLTGKHASQPKLSTRERNGGPH